MTGFTTQQVLIYDFPTGDFDDVTRSHPALKWLETYLRHTVETARWNFQPTDTGDLHEDAWIKTGQGHAAHNADDHFAIARELYGKYDDYYHTYDHIIVYETDDGWISLGTANFFYKSLNPSKQPDVKGPDSRLWEGVERGAYRIHYLKDANGKVKLGGVEIYNGHMSDTM